MAEANNLKILLLNELVDQDNTELFLQNVNLLSTGNEFLIEYFFSTHGCSPTRIKGYVSDVVPGYSDFEFKSHFRMKRETFEMLCARLAAYLPEERTTTPTTRLLSVLWLLGNLESFRGVADRFDISKGTLHFFLLQVCQALIEIMPDFISFPVGREEQHASAAGFVNRCSFPGVVGAIDGTHIAIPAPNNEHKHSYINRKGYASMVLQVVCDSSLKFLDICTGWPGSVHDARVFRNSPVREKIANLPEEFHLLGDSAYPLSTHLLVPFRDNGHLNPVQVNYNKAHSSTRIDVERSIGLLKGKFRRLKKLDMRLQMEIPNVIASCCVLHNLIIMSEQGADFSDLEDVDDNEIVEALNDPQVEISGVEKRNNIAELLA